MKKDAIGRYLERRGDLGSRPLVARELDSIEQVVVIPVLAERNNIEGVLESLAENATECLARTLVVCVVNNRSVEEVGEEVIADNRETIGLLDELSGAGAGKLGRLRLGYIDASSSRRELGRKEGVGSARKLGLDWGLEILRISDAKPGVLISLDADTHVDTNYLEAIKDHFSRGTGWGGVIDFAHRLEGSEAEQAAIVCYELFLRSHVLGLKQAGSPYAFHTVGSAMACTSEAYVASGGMNRRQAGEDFYFLQELAKTGAVERIAGAIVRPSPRPSWRVPFGTGRRVDRFLKATHDEYRVYHPKSYGILKEWLALVERHADADAEWLLKDAEGIDSALSEFLDEQEFRVVWRRLQEHARDTSALIRQFHRWFDGFKTLKLFHYLRDESYPDREMFEGIAELLSREGVAMEPCKKPGELSFRDQIEVLRRLREYA